MAKDKTVPLWSDWTRVSRGETTKTTDLMKVGLQEGGVGGRLGLCQGISLIKNKMVLLHPVQS